MSSAIETVRAEKMRRARWYRCVRAAALGSTFFALVFSGQRPGIAKGSAAPVTQTASFGPLVPGQAGAPATVQVPFRVPLAQAMLASGFKVLATSTFVFTPSAPSDGGKSITASSVGLGITGVSSTLASQGAFTVARGFDYDPVAAQATGKSKAFAGAAYGQATLADLVTSREVLRAARVSGGKAPTGGTDLIVNFKIAVPSQFFTPGSFSGTITLIVSP